MASRIAYVLNLKGPAVAVDTACSSSLVAIHLGCQGLWNRETDLVLAGGVFIRTTPEFYILTSQARMLSPDGQCFTFDNRANGFVPGEGVGVVMLKRLGDAIGDNDPIYGVIKGSGMNQDGSTNGITAPSAISQKQLELDVYQKFNIDPRTIQYVEAHGTGTKLGDPIEVQALTASFRDHTDQRAYCALGSVKTNVGHMVTAAGVGGLIKILLAMKHGEIPPSLNMNTYNEHINFSDSPFYVNTELKKWTTDDASPRRAALSSFGFSGTNAHMVIEEYQDKPTKKPFFSSDPMIIPLSAQTRERLKVQVEELLHFLTDRLTTVEDSIKRETFDLMDMAYTLQVGREAMNCRIAFVVKETGELKEKLTQYLKDDRNIMDFWQGEVKAGHGAFAALTADEDTAAMVQNRLHKGMVHKLAELWVKGVHFDWDLLYDDVKPRRISLPTYPFAGQRYWVPETGRVPATHPGVNRLHPLVHENTSTLEQQQFTSTFTGMEFYINDHEVLNEKILPGVAYLEMAVAATLKAGNHPVHKLKDVVWTRPVRVSTGPVTVTIRLYPETHGIVYEVTTQNASDKSQIVHGRGRVITGQPEARPPVQDIQEIKRRCTEELSRKTCYGIFRDLGLHYGPGLQGIVELFYNDREVLAKIALPEVAGSGFYLHPGILDSALQASIGLVHNSLSGTAPFVPFALKEAALFESLEEAAYVHATYSDNGTATDETAAYDIMVLNHRGETLVHLKELVARRMNPGQEEAKEVRPLRVETVPQSQGMDETGPSGPWQNPLDRPDIDEQKRLAGAVKYIKEELSRALRLPVSVIDETAPLEKYGINSLLITELTVKLEEIFGTLSKTLFFEYQTIHELAGYFAGEHGATLTRLVDRDNTPIKPGDPRQDSALVRMMDQDNIQTKHLTAPISDGKRHLKARGARFSTEKRTREDGLKSAPNIAIIGLGGRYPKADTLEEFWENIKQGRDCITEIPEDRWDWKQYFDPEKGRKGKSYSKWGGFINDVDKFDPLFFNISPKEAEILDPQERLFLQTAWETMEDAGYNIREQLKSDNDLEWGRRIGVYVGVMYEEYQLYGAMGAMAGDRLRAIGGNPSSVANRVSYFLNLNGPSMAVDTMCSSSLTAIHLACRDINSGVCDMALAGGVNITIHPKKYLFLSQGGFVSSKGRCESFGMGGDGYIPGEGVGCVLLKPLKRAMEDHDHIYGVIKGTAINHGGKTNGYTVPNPGAQSQVIAQALKEADITPEAVSYVEAHGTGTKLGDPIEITGLTKAYREYSDKAGWCAIGSVKSNIGHCESAAGIAGITKVLLQMKHRQIAPSLHSGVLNPNIDFAKTPFVVPQELVPWLPPESVEHGITKIHPRIGAISSFGAGGSNAHLIIEEYVSERDVQPAPASQGKVLIPLSARNSDRLKASVERLVNFLAVRDDQPALDGQPEIVDSTDEAIEGATALKSEQHRKLNLCDMAYTLQIGREAMNSRIAFVVTDMGELKEKLTRYLAGDPNITDFWQGGVKADKDAFAILMADEDARAMVGKWLAKGKIGKLAELWVKGFNLDWDLLYGDLKPERISLPTYPFDRQRYWVPDADLLPAIHSGMNRLHPLVHENTSTLERQQFTSTFTGMEFFIRDHEVLNEKILPGVAYLEMAVAATGMAITSMAAGRKAGNNPVRKLNDVVWTRPIRVNTDPETVTISLYPETDRIAYEVTTQKTSDKLPIVHSQGRIITGQAKAKPPVRDIQAIKDRCSKELSRGTCYEIFRELGLHYGPGFQGISGLHYNDREVLAKIALPEVAGAGFYLHPGVLDSALQASIGLAHNRLSGMTPFVPFALKEVELFEPLEEKVYAHVTYSDNGPTAETATYDMTVLNTRGETLVHLKELITRQMKLNRKEAGEQNLWYTVPEWQNQNMDGMEGISPSQEGAVHIILMDQDEDLSRILEERLNPKSLLTITTTDHPGEIIQAFKRCFFHIRHLMENRPSSAQTLVVVISEDIPAYCYAPIGGLLKTARLENPAIQGKIVQLPELSPEQAADILIKEAQTNKEARTNKDDQTMDVRTVKKTQTTADMEVRYLKGTLQRQVKRPKEIKASPVPLVKSVKKGGVYWITGGLGGLGRIFAKAFGEMERITVILSGRREPDEAAQKDLEGLQAMAQPHGSAIEYMACDVTDPASVSRTIEIITEKYHHPNGIIHSAGIIKDSFIIRKTEAEIGSVMGPKVHGAWNIAQTVQMEALDFMVFFSSIVGLLGNPGQADYAGANAFLDAFAACRSDKTHIISINWPLWKEGGMGMADGLLRVFRNRTGMLPLETTQGISSFCGLLALDFQVHHRNFQEGAQAAVWHGEREKITQYIGLQPSGKQPLDEQTSDKGPSDKRMPDSVNHSETGLRTSVEADLIRICTDLLKVRPEDLDPDGELSEYGVDSILMMEILNAVEIRYGQPISPSALIDYPTIGGLADYLVKSGIVQVNAQEPEPENEEGRARIETPSEPQNIVSFGAKSKRGRFMPPDRQTGHNKIAIIGMACRLPQSPDPESFWENLAAGRNLVREVSPDRWDPQAFFDPDPGAPNKTYTNHAGFLDNIADFDAACFGISDDEALILDPQHRIMLELSRELFDHAGLTRADLSNTRTGVFIGAKDNHYLRNHYHLIPQGAMQHILVNNISNMMAARISDFYNLKGASKSIDTACSSSLVAVDEACRSIINKETDMVVAGGIYLLMDPFAHIGFSKAKVLSNDGKSYVFDERAGGFVLGEGAGLVLLKDYEQALWDGDCIHCVILGSAVNNDGKTMGLTVPNQESQKRVMQSALDRSGIDPGTITYLEAHGTGTLLGDPIEIKAATEVYGQYTRKTGACALGSVKSNLGHTMMAAGITGLIKILLCMKHRQIPPTLHCESPHPRFRFDESPFYPHTRLTPWAPENGIMRAAISSFGFGGTNCHMIVEEGPRDAEPQRHPLTPRRFNRKHYWLGHPIVEVKGNHPSPGGDRLLDDDRLSGGDRQERLDKAESNPLVSASYQYNEPYLADHLILDEQVLMGVTYCSLGLDGIRKIHNNGGQRIKGIKKLLFVEPVTLNHGEEVTIGVYAHDTLFDVVAQKRSGTTSFSGIVVASGEYDILDNIAASRPPRTDIHKIKKEASQTLTGKQIYTNTKERDVIYGKSLRTIVQIYQSHDHVLSRLELTPEMTKDGHEYAHVHPAILDGAITGALTPAFLVDGLDGPYLPLIIKAVTTHAPLPSHCYAYSKIIKKNREIIECDLSLLDDEGEVCLEVKGFVYKRLHTENRAVVVENDEKKLFEPEEKSPHIHDDLSMEIQRFISRKIKQFIPGSNANIPLDQNFMDLGINSKELIQLVNIFETEIGIELYPTLFFEYPNIASLARFFGTEHGDEWRKYLGKDFSRKIENKPLDPPLQFHEKSGSHPEPHLFGLPKISSSVSHQGRDSIAIIGMAGVFAESPDANTFWHHLYQQTHLIKEIPLDHFDHGPWFSPERQSNRMYCKWGSFIDDVDQFDAGFFNISPKEAGLMDPQLRHLLQVLYHTAEDAGCLPAIKGSRTGIYVGVCCHDYSEEMARTGKEIQAHDGTGNAATMLANRPSFYFNLKGPSLAVDTACSSSLYSVHLARKALEQGECEMAFAAGANLLLTSSHYRYFCSLGILSPTGRCHTFDKRADGYVPGEAIAAVLLKPLSRAVADGDHIYGILKGSAVSHGGYTPSITAPNVDGEVEVLIQAWKDGDISPEMLDYLEAHGTGTQLGDPVEVNALKKAFKKFTEKESFCALGSAKAHIGHAEGGAGITGLVKVLLSMKHQTIPAMPDFKEINPYIKIEGSPFYINQEPVKWTPQKDPQGNPLPRRAGISSFGFGGAYAHLVIEEYIAGGTDLPGQAYNGDVLVPLSARNADTLKKYARSLHDGLGDGDRTALMNVAYTLQTGREAMNSRIAFVVNDMAELREKLSQYLKGEESIADVWQGALQKGQDGFMALTMDEDIQAAMHNWLMKGKIRKLAEFWVNGMDFDWNLLYGEARPRKVSLPGYPFEKERYWLPKRPERPAVPAETGSSTIGPLVHGVRLSESLKEAGTVLFESILHHTLPMLDHHRVQGRVLMPGAGYIEMVTEAVKHIYPDKHFVMKNVLLLKPLDITDASQQVYLKLTHGRDTHERENGAMGFEIRTGTDETATRHCQGSVVITDQPPKKEQVDLESMRQRLTFKWDDNAGARAFYKRLADNGFQYGTYFQCIKGIWASDEEILTKVALSGTWESEDSLYRLHPALMDAAFHGIAAFVTLTDRQYLTFSLKQVEPRSRLEATMWGVIGQQRPGRYDLRLVNSKGEVCVKCAGFEVRPASHLDDDGITYLSRWVRHAHDNRETAENRDGTCLVVSNGKAFGFDESILSARKGAVMIRTGSRTRPLGDDGAWEIDRSDLQAWERIFTENQPVTTLYFLCGLWDQDRHQDRSGQDGFAESVRDEETVVMDFFRCIKALMRSGYGSRTLNLVVPTRDVQPVYGHQPINPTGASLSGFVQTLAKEQPRWRIKHVDISADDLRNRDNHIDLLARLNNEPADPMGHPVAFRHGYRYTREIIPVSMPDNPPVKIRRQGVYVILGGAGGLGAAFSEYLIKTYDARMIWLGRRPVDRDIQEKITRLGRYGTEPIYIQTDALDSGQMKAAYETVKTHHTMVHGVIHSAIVLRDQILQNMDERDFKAALMPKLAGAVHLAQAFGKANPDWICFFSSIQSLWGAPGQSNYTAGCTFKDAFGLYLRQQLNYPVHIINWGYWGEIGVAAQDFYRDRMKAQGVGSLDIAEGTQILEKVLGHDVPQILSVKLDRTNKLPLGISDTLRTEDPVIYPAKEAQGMGQQIIAAESHGYMAQDRTMSPPLRTVQPKKEDHAKAVHEPDKIGPPNQTGANIHERIQHETAAVLGMPVQKVPVDKPLSELGLDSIMAVELINRINRQLSIDLETTVLFDHITIDELAAHILSEHIPVPDTHKPVRLDRKQRFFQPSLEQSRHLALMKLTGSQTALMVPLLLRVSGRLDPDYLQQAVDQLVLRHESLRTVFTMDRDQPVLEIKEILPLRIDIIDAQNRDEAWVLAHVSDVQKENFDLEAGPLGKILVYQQHQSAYLLILMLHIVVDGISVMLLSKELMQLYNALGNGKRPVPEPLDLQHVDFSAWERMRFEGPEGKTRRLFWERELVGYGEETRLPFKYNYRRGLQNDGVALLEHVWGGEFAHKLSTFCGRQRFTHFTVFMTGLMLTQYLFSEQVRQCVAMPDSNRDLPGFQKAIGFYANLAVLPLELSSQEPLKNICHRVQERIKDILSGRLPYNDLVNIIRREQPDHDIPPVQTALSYVDTRQMAGQRFSGTKVEFIHLKREALDFDIFFTLFRDADQYRVQMEYPVHLFDPQVLIRFGETWEKVMMQLMEQPDDTPEHLFEITGCEKRKKINVVSTYTMDPIKPGLDQWIRDLDWHAAVHLADFNQVFQELGRVDSLFRTTTSGLNVIALRFEDWLEPCLKRGNPGEPINPAGVDWTLCEAHLSNTVSQFTALLTVCLKETELPHVLLITPASPGLRDQNAYQDLEARQIGKLKEQLSGFSNVTLLTDAEIQTWYPVSRLDDKGMDTAAHMPYQIPYFMSLASVVIRTAHQYWMSPKKVFVVDCDNTLWKGIVGEDGVGGISFDGARQKFMRTLIAQQEAGALIALCSKNEAEDVRTVFAKRSADFPLKEDHLVAMKVNWDPKPANIRALAQELNLGLDSFVFIDDNPVEIEAVRLHCPGVACLLFPQKPDDIERFICHTWFFDKRGATKEDKNRTRMYREETRRRVLKESVSSFDDFLAQLYLNVDIEKMDSSDIPRVSQLTLRTNQFNSTTIRRMEPEVESLCQRKDLDLLTVRVKDRFGDYGLVGVLILGHDAGTTVLESMILSCRVLGRGVEHRMLKAVGDMALARGNSMVNLIYEPTPKNRPVFQCFSDLKGANKVDHGKGFMWVCEARALSDGTLNSPTGSPKKGMEKPVKHETPGNSGVTPPDIWLRYGDSCTLSTAVKRTTRKTLFSGNRVAPVTPTEKAIESICQSLLNQEELCVETDFFKMGVTSMELVNMLVLIESRLGVSLDYQILLQNTTIRKLADKIDSYKRTGNMDFIPDTTYLADRDMPLHLNMEVVEKGRHASSGWNHILLTGATGYVGSYLLFRLLEKTGATIHCLIRHTGGKEKALAKLYDNLSKYHLDRPVRANESRLVIIPGDFSKPEFGLEADEYDHLAQKIDRVFHIGAKVSFLLPYREQRASNVLGVKHVIEFCARKKSKKCEYMSSTAIIDSDLFDHEQVIGERPLDVDDPMLGYGYAQSKWVGEELMQRAATAGMAVTRYRASGIAPSLDRFCRLNMGDTLALIMLAIIDMDVAPDFPNAIADFTRLDYIADTIVERSHDTEGGIVHVSHPRPVTFDRLMDLLRDFGLKLTKRPYHDWVKLFDEYAKTSRIPNMDRLSPLLKEKVQGTNRSWFELAMDRPRFDIDGNRSRLTDTCEAFDSKLALRHLMVSFLTMAAYEPLPEKKCAVETLILTCSTGGGHNTVAYAIKDKLSGASNEISEVLILDKELYTYQKMTRVYNHLTKHNVGLYATMHDLMFEAEDNKYVIETEIYRKYARYILKSYHPQKIISVHSYASKLFEEIKTLSPAIGCYTVVTDWFEGCLPGWADAYADWVYCPSEPLRDYLIKIKPGVAGKCIAGNYPYAGQVNRVKGMDKNDVMQRLNLDENKPVVTFCMGTDQALAKQISQVLSDYAGVQFVITCYGNRTIFDIFRDSVGNGRHQVHLYLENLIEYLFCSDLVFTKPGPAMVCEAIQLGAIPVIMEAGGIMPQEQAVRDYLIQNNLGLSASSLEDITALLDRLTTRKSTFDPMRARLETAGFESGLDDIVRLINDPAAVPFFVST